METSFARSLANIEVAISAATAERRRLAERFLAGLGYLRPPKVLSTESLSVSVQTFSQAVVRFQEFYGLQRTGELDEFTLAKMAEPRCGCRDIPPPSAAPLRCAWEKRALAYDFDTPSQDISPSQDAFAAVRAAFDTWEALGKVSFIKGSSPNVDIIIKWTNALENDFSLVGTAIAHSDFPGSCFQVTPLLPKPLHFDDSESRWGIGDPSAYDVESVALHEIGHILGLEHSQNPNSVMYPSFREGNIKNQLLQQDIQGFLRLYP